MTDANKSLENLIKILLIDKKSSLRKHLDEITISISDLSNLVIACEARILPWAHRISYRDFVPQHLQPKSNEPIDGRAIARMSQLLRERRYLVGHMFFDLTFTNWHFFYFDQRDIGNQSAHWVGGPHIHLINHLWPNESAEDIWRRFNSGNPQMRRALHVRFDREARRGL